MILLRRYRNHLMNPQPNTNTMDDYQVSRNYPLFEHMADQHNLILLEDELCQIERIVLEMHNINPEKCTMNPQSNPHVSRTIPEQIEHQVREKGNQLDQVYGAMKEKTPMQQLHQWAVDKWSDPSRLISLYEVVNKIEEMLENENKD